jgi:DNA-binding NarL/FixJ family response regulator
MMRILIADDHVVVRRGICEIIKSAYPDVTFGQAATTPEAIALLMAEEWDLILLDINMPGRSGFEVLEESKKVRAQTPVIILSCYSEKEFAVRAFKSGASGYLNKSIGPDELLAAISKVIAGGRYVPPSLAEHFATVIGTADVRPLHETLSGRELQVLRHVASGQTLKEVAAEMGLSEKTIATYRARISEKLQISSNVDLTRYVCQHNLLE